MTEVVKGGCLCGAVRYEFDAPAVATMACHCTHCQKQSGGPMTTLAMIPRDKVRIAGELKTFVDQGQSGGAVLRKFCGGCGSPIISDIAAFPDVLFVKTGTLDDSSAVTPETHLWTSSAQGWMVFPEGVQKIEQQ